MLKTGHVPAEKPVVVGEFGAQLPMADRIGIFQAVYDEVLDAATDGLPAAGAPLPKPPTLLYYVRHASARTSGLRVTYHTMLSR